MKVHPADRPQSYIVQALGMESSKYGGLEKYCVFLAEYLTRHNVTLIIIYNAFPWSNEYVRDIEKAGGILIISHAMHPVRYFRTLAGIFKKYKPMIVHTHFQNYFPILYSRILGCKRIYASIHGMIIDEKSNFINHAKQLSLRKRIQKRFIYFLSSRIFAVSEAVRIQYMNVFPQVIPKIETRYLGVLPNENRQGKSRKILKISENMISIVNIGFNSPVKGLDILFEALSIIKKKHSYEEFILVHIGIDITDPINSHYLQDAEKNEIEQKVKWMGIRNDVAELLPGLDIYCQPSRSEALGLSLMEAGMAGLPVVGSNVGGIPEIVQDNYNGFLFESGNAFQLAEKLLRLIRDEELRKRMGKRSKKLMMKNFNIHRQATEMAQIYLKACD